MKFRPLASLFVMASLAALTLPVAAQEAHTHVHGRAGLDIALEGNEITATLRTPMDNLVGFEHAPRTAEQRARVEQTRKQLQQFDQLLVPDPAAKCSLNNIDIVWDALEHAGHDDHHGHADVEITAQFICTGSGNPAYIDANLLQTFPGLHQLVVQSVTQTGQSGATLTRDNARLRLD